MVLELNKDNFEEEVLRSDKPVLVDFWASWCGPCRMMAPVFEETGKEYAEKVKFTKLSTETNQDIAEKYSIRGIPCLILFSKGKEFDRFVGYMTKEQLKDKLDDALSRLKQTTG